MITKNKEVLTAAMKFAQARLSPPTFGQIAAEAALDTKADYFAEVLEEYHKRRKTVYEAINKMPGGLSVPTRQVHFMW